MVLYYVPSDSNTLKDSKRLQTSRVFSVVGQVLDRDPHNSTQLNQSLLQ